MSADPAPPWLARVARRAARWAAGGAGPAWVVAVSGGSDSVGLLRALHAVGPGAGLTLSVAHLDHGARGEAARADADFVEALARGLGLPCDLGRWQPVRPAHFEADARRARHDWLAETARARGAAAVAAGHTRDDQAETVLHRVVRGTGVLGLAGIPARRPLGPGVALLRPLLDVSRQEIRAYLAGLGQPFRDDPTNADPARTRARLRHDLLPKLAEDYNPKIAEALARLARLAAASARADRHRVRGLGQFLARADGRDAVVFRRAELLRLPRHLRAEAIRGAWREAGWPEGAMGAARWWRLARLVRRDRPGRFDVGGGIAAETGPGLFTLVRAAGMLRHPEETPRPSPLTIPGAAPWPGGRVVATLDPDAGPDETVDADRLVPPFWVRGPEPGDRFAPLGMSGHETPLNDFFRGRRVPPGRRAETPLVVDRLGIVWVVGHRIADRVRLTDATTRTAGLRWEPFGPSPAG